MRISQINNCIAMVITDIHGNLEIYKHYRNLFFDLQKQGKVDTLVFCGDLLHRRGDDYPDQSLEIITDVIKLQQQHGKNTIIVILGNHELPHIYAVPLSRGEVDVSGPFERTLEDSGMRKIVIDFLHTLPFFIQTGAGVLINHSGGSSLSKKEIAKLKHFNHRELIDKYEEKMQNKEKMLKKFMINWATPYDEMVSEKLAVDSKDDPRYYDLLRSFQIGRDADFELLWKILFSFNERQYSSYDEVLGEFLKRMSLEAPVAQKFLVSGHIDVENGYKVIANRQLRMASWAHAIPREKGKYLLLNCHKPIESIDDLLSGLHEI